jgi:hypothetical protein
LVAEVDTARAAQGLPLASALRLAALTHARTGPAAAIRQDQSQD